jgi:hypothetical protein
MLLRPSFFWCYGVGEETQRAHSTKPMKFVGKTRVEIERELAGRSRSELIDLIFSLSTVEQLFKPSEIAARSCINKRAVLKDIRDGKFGPYFCRAENSIAVPASGVNSWRRRFLVPSNNARTT